MNSSRAPTLILTEPRPRQICRALREVRLEQFDWAYVGQSLPRFLKVQDTLRAGRRIDFASPFHETVAAVRDDYIDYIGALSARHDSLRWWTSGLAEKNPWISRAFLWTAYVVTCLKLVDEYEGGTRSLVLVVECRAVRRAIAANRRDGIALRRYDGPGWAAHIFGVLTSLARHVGVATAYSGRILHCRLTGLARAQRRWVAGNGPLTLLFTWIIDVEQFGTDGSFEDRYFPGLVHRARREGASMVTVPIIFGRAPYYQIAKRITTSTHPFLLPSALLRIRDVWGAAVRSLTGTIQLGLDTPRFRGLDVRPVLRADITADKRHHRTIRALLFHRLPERLRDLGMVADTVVLPFENHIWARGLLLGLRNVFPRARTVGYQHTSIRSLELNLFIAAGEAQLAPIPDRIVANGEHPADLLRSSGYPAGRVTVGPALRYGKVLEALDKPRPGARDTILVAPSIGEEESAEVVWKALQAYSEESANGMRVLIKCHPLRPWDRIAAMLGVGELLAHVEVAERPLSSLMEDAAVFVYSTTSGVLEACAVGVPCIHIRPEFDLDFDPLEATPEARLEVRTPGELRAATKRLLIEGGLAKDLKKHGRAAVRRLLAPVNEDSYAALLAETMKSRAS